MGKNASVAHDLCVVDESKNGGLMVVNLNKIRTLLENILYICNHEKKDVFVFGFSAVDGLCPTLAVCGSANRQRGSRAYVPRTIDALWHV